MWETFAVHLPLAMCIENVAEIIEKVGHWGIFKAQKLERNLSINVTCIHNVYSYASSQVGLFWPER